MLWFYMYSFEAQFKPLALIEYHISLIEACQLHFTVTVRHDHVRYHRWQEVSRAPPALCHPSNS